MQVIRAEPSASSLLRQCDSTRDHVIDDALIGWFFWNPF
jgi:hypothetical protein